MPWEKQIGQGNRALASGMYAEAFQYFAMAIAEASATSSGDSLWAEAHRGLAKSAIELGKYEEAEKACRAALKTDEDFWGCECAAVSEDLFLLAESLRLQGKFEVAMSPLNRALQFFTGQYGDTHAQSLQIFASMILLYLESGIKSGFPQLHARAFAAYQAVYPTGMWANYLQLPKLVERYEAKDETKRLDEILARELNVLRNTLGSKHKELQAVVDCHSDALKRSKRHMAAWQVQAKTTHVMETVPASEALYYEHDATYKVGASPALAIIERLFSSDSAIHLPHAPAALHQSRWQIVRRDPEHGRLYVNLIYDDGHTPGYKSADPSLPKAGTARIELEIAVQGAPDSNECSARYQWRLHGSAAVSLARGIVQCMLQEVQQTLAVLPGAYTGAIGTGTPVTKITSPLGMAISKGTTWPSPQHYNEAIQNPQQAFFDTDLQAGLPDLNALGLPRPLSGAFATVYQIQSGSNRWAVKCFTERVSDQQKRYQAISNRLHHLQVPFFTDFDYQQTGIKVQGITYPVLKMKWVEGQPLTVYVLSHLGNQEKLSGLAQEFYDLVSFLEYLGVAHGDLQHGNILVNHGKLSLVDYDGMFVPEIAELKSNELGHRNYQHPKRNAQHFGAYLDYFSAWVIYVSLFAVSRDPDLWESLGSGDEALLFKREDFVAPENSKVFNTLIAHSDSDVRNAASFLSRLTRMDLPAIPPFSKVFNKT